MRITAALVLAAAVVISSAAVFSAARSKKPERKLIGVSLLKINNDFYMQLKNGLQKAAKKHGFDLMILSADDDEAKQAQNVDSLLAKNISALIICPVNPEGAGDLIKKATDKGIPVFTMDVPAASGKVVAHIASDNYAGGKLAADRMFKLIGNKGKVAIVTQPGIESFNERATGFADTAKNYGMTVIEPFANGKNDMQESEHAVSSLIEANPDIRGIFAADDNMAFGAFAAIQTNVKNIALIGFGGAAFAREKIDLKAAWKADVAENPEKIGSETIDTIDRYFKGEIQYPGRTITVPVPVGLAAASKTKKPNEAIKGK